MAREFTVEETAAILNVTERAVQKLQSEGLLSKPVTDAEVFAALREGFRMWSRRVRREKKNAEKNQKVEFFNKVADTF